MLETKMFELRDEGTCIPIMATRMNPIRSVGDNSTEARWSLEAENWLLARSGFGKEGAPPRELVIVTNLNTWQSGYSGHDVHAGKWQGGPRTLPVAVQYINDNWDKLRSGDVVDVRVALGEQEHPAKSDRFFNSERVNLNDPA
jgi:hypothetical protein